MTRIPVVAPEEAPPAIQQWYAWTMQQFGVVPEPFAVLANHPSLYAAYSEQEAGAAKAMTVLPVNIRDIAQYRVAWTIGCSWCIDFGKMISRLHGLDIEQLKEIEDFATSPRFSDDERAAIAYADAMTSTPTAATDEQVADLERRFGRDGVVELTFVIALENLRSRMNAALGITDQGFTSGEACRVPWAKEAREA